MLMALVMTGCAQVRQMMYKTTGDVMVMYAQEVQVPYVLTTQDVDMNCGMSQALTPLLMSFGQVRGEPNKLGVMVYGSAGICAEARAREEGLRYLRAIKAQDPNEAEDALAAQKRWHVLAAERNYTAYKHLVAAFGEPGGECPALKEDFDQLIYLMGLLSGLQALNNEIASTTSVGVPKNVAAKAERAAGCLDDKKWWGAPMALKATVWALLPGATPKGEDPWLRLENAAKIGERKRVRLAHVFWALAAQSQGKTDVVKDVIRRHAKAKHKKMAKPKYRFVDELATSLLLAISDEMWTEATGHRTPAGAFGTFWDDQKAPPAETVDLDDLL
ncbi:MAG: hypothetical protein D6758_00655 [Gammaproteobacteria bacterium]|nr:MAG: hypothetical protein D6758_00655 [Gammaproteobacteria bacterium]